mmetsp:Transcript_7060/g.11889  ORF Transcript_7060/g.11889 Transcript_7060/m.11889 type:complete len:112 (-) Transcript_7060:73-408(-)
MDNFTVEEGDFINQGEQENKIIIELKAVGSAPILNQTKLAAKKSMLFGQLNKKIKNMLVKSKAISQSDSLIMYMSQSISPPPSLTLGDLVKQYGIDGENLHVKYALTEAWG